MGHGPWKVVLCTGGLCIVPGYCRMNYPQIVGLKCWYCNKTISSITEGRFCSSCCNPIHLTCTLPGRTAVPEGRCAECGADPQSPLALEVKAEIQKRATDPQIICPSCGSTHGFGPFRTDSSPDPNVRIFGGAALPPYVDHGGRGKQWRAAVLQMPIHLSAAQPWRSIGCMVVLLLGLAAIVALIILVSKEGVWRL